MEKYDPQAIERKWQAFWREKSLDRTREQPRRKFYMLEMFAYPSGDIHMGHFRNYGIGDVVARYRRMCGHDVLHPFGWDAFGLPAENAAIQHGVHPAEWTYRNIDRSRASLQRMGISYDWDREIFTCREDFYRFTQWMFLLLRERGLAYRAKAAVNWCPVDQTVLANEHVVDGCCWRHPTTPVEKKELEQWFFRITEYAERLLEGLDRLDGWPENVRAMQRNWIGKSTGAEVDFALEGGGEKISVFTTRPDTLWGVTFLTLAPEHPLALKLPPSERDLRAVRSYAEAARSKTEIERTDVSRTKDGVPTGAYAVHPLTGERIPIWVADYVLATYGTGAVMGVPAHDQRDFEFARAFGLPIRVVIQPFDRALDSGTMPEAYVNPGTMASSPPFDGMNSEEAIPKVISYLEEKGVGRAKIQYRLRDWLISRQRYWGCPIPMVHCPVCGIVPVPKDELPVRLPDDVESFIPTGRSPLEDVANFINTSCPRCGEPARRDPDTMDTFMCSSWYHLRYVDPHNDREPFSRSEAKRWLPVDLYVGGVEHATGHLLYFRFFTKVLHDAGWLEIDEPVVRLFNHGMVLDEQGEVMSKSKGNVVAPVSLFERYGADVSRLAMFFFAPSEDQILWNEKGAEGMRRFVQRVWDLVLQTAERKRALSSRPLDVPSLSKSARTIRRYAHRTIRRATEAMGGDLGFNTVIAMAMELVNEIRRAGDVASWSEKDFPALEEAVRSLVLCLAPMAPHLGEELWQRLGEEPSVFQARWPELDPEALREETLELPVQINGKVRSHITVAVDASEQELQSTALADARVQEILSGRAPRKVIVVPKRLVNVVV
jgi:leucyl-tRNA synthetase